MRKIRSEKGSATVELSFLIPMILFIIVIMMFFGLFMYEQVAAQAVMDDVISRAAANWATLNEGVNVEKSNTESFNVWDIYSRIIDFMDNNRETVIKEEALKRLKSVCLFANNVEASDITLDCTNIAIYKTLDLTIDRSVELPFPGFLEMMDLPTELNYKLTATAIVQDQPELIRTMDIAGDMLKKNNFIMGLYEKMQGAMGSMSEFFRTFKR